MSTFVYYQAIPFPAQLLRFLSGKESTAAEARDSAEDALYSIMLGFHLKYPGYLGIKYPLVNEFCKEYPDHPEWHFDSHPLKIAAVYKLISAMDSDANRANRNVSRAEFEKTLGYQIVRGYEPFSELYSRKVGGNFRVSPPHFVTDCAIHCQVIDRDVIPEGLQEYFDGLVNFYKTVAFDNRLAVLVMEA